MVSAHPARAAGADGPRTGRYEIGGETASPSAYLSYADLAVAMVDEIEAPRHHRTRVSVYNRAPGAGRTR
jgi:putative NADH-flavin reductase